jgi:hypothetical protein
MQFLLTIATMHDIQASNLLYVMSWDLNDWVKLRITQPSFLDFYSLNMKIIDGWKFPNVQVHFFQDCWKIKTCSIKQNTMYHDVIHVEIKVCYVIFKFAHGVSFLVCNEFVVAMNITCRKLIT